MKIQIKKQLNKYREIRYNLRHKNEALRILDIIEKDTNYKLNNKMKKLIDEYANEVLGSKMYAPWLYVYTAYNQEFKEGWIPDNYFGYIVAPKVNNGLGTLAATKTLSKKVLHTDLLPDKFYVIDNTLYDINFNIVSNKNLKEVLFKESNDYFLKLNNSSQARGVFKISKNNFELDQIYGKGDAVIQTPIIQADFFEEVVPGSVATLRINTVKNKNKEIEFSSSFLRFGRQNETFVKVKSSINVPIIDSDGSFGIFASDPSWKRYYSHPDTGYEFAGKKVPYFKEVVRTCTELHKKIPHVGIIAWDVSVTNEGEIFLMEWNAKHPGIKFPEATVGPTFKELGWDKLHREERKT